MNYPDLQKDLDSIANPPDADVEGERAQISRGNRFRRDFILTLLAFTVLGWVLSSGLVS